MQEAGGAAANKSRAEDMRGHDMDGHSDGAGDEDDDADGSGEAKAGEAWLDSFYRCTWALVCRLVFTLFAQRYSRSRR
jgi:hypothetical protein